MEACSATGLRIRTGQRGARLHRHTGDAQGCRSEPHHVTGPRKSGFSVPRWSPTRHRQPFRKAAASLMGDLHRLGGVARQPASRQPRTPRARRRSAQSRQRGTCGRAILNGVPSRHWASLMSGGLCANGACRIGPQPSAARSAPVRTASTPGTARADLDIDTGDCGRGRAATARRTHAWPGNHEIVAAAALPGEQTGVPEPWQGRSNRAHRRPPQRVRQRAPPTARRTPGARSQLTRAWTLPCLSKKRPVGSPETHPRADAGMDVDARSCRRTRSRRRTPASDRRPAAPPARQNGLPSVGEERPPSG